MWIYTFPTLKATLEVRYDKNYADSKHPFRIKLAEDHNVYLTQEEAQLLSVQMNAALYEAYTTTEDDES